MRVFGAVVEPTANLVTVDVADLFHRSRIKQSPSVTTFLGRPYFFMMRFRNLSAAALSRFAVTTVSKTSPS
jgi:hypothetical protein